MFVQLRRGAAPQFASELHSGVSRLSTRSLCTQKHFLSSTHSHSGKGSTFGSQSPRSHIPTSLLAPSVDKKQRGGRVSKTRPEERGEGGEEEEDDADGCEEDEGGGTPSPDTIAKAPASSPAKRPGSARASLRKLLRGKHLFCLLGFFFLPFLSLNISIAARRRSSLTPPWRAVKRKRNTRRQTGWRCMNYVLKLSKQRKINDVGAQERGITSAGIKCKYV